MEVGHTQKAVVNAQPVGAMKDEPPHISADVLDSISADTAWILLWVRRPDLRPSVEVLKTFAGRVESWKRVLEIAHQNDLG